MLSLIILVSIDAYTLLYAVMENIVSHFKLSRRLHFQYKIKYNVKVSDRE